MRVVKKKNIKGKRGSPDSASLDPLIALCDLDGYIVEFLVVISKDGDVINF